MDLTDRLVAIVEALFQNGDASVRELATAAGLPKSTVGRLLMALARNGWATQSGAGRYHIGYRLLELATEDLSNRELVRQARGVMEDLCAASRGTVLLITLEGLRGVCQHKVEPEVTLKLVAQVGKSFPLHAAACGKILLAYADDERRLQVLNSPLEAYTPHTIVDPKRLKAELEQVRARGRAVSYEEMTHGAAEIAVPVLSASGRLIAGLSIAGPSFQVQPRFEEFYALLSDAAGRLSCRLNDGTELAGDEGGRS